MGLTWPLKTLCFYNAEEASPYLECTFLFYSSFDLFCNVHRGTWRHRPFGSCWRLPSSLTHNDGQMIVLRTVEPKHIDSDLVVSSDESNREEKRNDMWMRDAGFENVWDAHQLILSSPNAIRLWKWVLLGLPLPCTSKLTCTCFELGIKPSDKIFADERTKAKRQSPQTKNSEKQQKAHTKEQKAATLSDCVRALPPNLYAVFGTDSGRSSRILRDCAWKNTNELPK